MINYPRYLIEEIFSENECESEILTILINLGFNFSQLEQLSYFEGNWDKLLDYVKPEYSVNMIKLIRDLVYYDKDLDYNLSKELNDSTISKIRFKEKLKYYSKKRKNTNFEEDESFIYTEIMDSDDSINLSSHNLLDLFSDDYYFDEPEIELYEDLDETNFFETTDTRTDKLIERYKIKGYFSNYEVLEPFINFPEKEVDYYHTKFFPDSKIMSKQEEYRVFQLSLSDPKYKELFIINNFRLALSLAKKYFHRAKHLGIDDIIQEATIGVIHAYSKYDPSLGYKFSTYANWHIIQKIVRFLGDFNDIIRIPIHQGELNNKYTADVDKFYLENYDYPNEHDLKEFEEAYSEEGIKKIKACDFEIVELNDKHTEYIYEGNQTSQDDFFRKFLALTKEILSDREHEVLAYRFGLNDFTPRTLEDIGTKMNVTRERIRQIESKAIRKLQSSTRMKSLLARSGYAKGE